MSIIDNTYFKGDIALSTSWNDEIDLSIPVVEEAILRKLLGDTLYAEYLANPTDAKWVALVDGEDYIYDSYTISWKGLKGSNQKSLLAYFTYEYLLRDNDEQVSNKGVIRQSSEKGEDVSVNSKMCNAQNKGVDLFGSVHDSYLKPSAYNFLRHSSYTFEDWVFTPIAKINRFGI